MKNRQNSLGKILVPILCVALGISAVVIYTQQSETSVSPNISAPLHGRFVLKDASCAGFEFGSSTSQVIWRNEIECSISDTNPDYYHTLSVFWLDDQTFVTKDIERTSPSAPPRVDIYIVQKYDGKDLVLKELWTGWGDFSYDALEFVKR